MDKQLYEFKHGGWDLTTYMKDRKAQAESFLKDADILTVKARQIQEEIMHLENCLVPSTTKDGERG